jgi:hypothetical protein
MQTRKRILMIGASAMMAVAEAALRGTGGLDVRRVNDLGEMYGGEYSAIFLEDSLPGAETAAVLRAHPGIPVILLHWQRAAFTLVVGYQDHSLTLEELNRVLERA